MKPRAFVVMPFGTKPTGSTPDARINFELVYKDLLEPVLEQAGYEVVRADSEPAAGDIRTDMFFELVTADLVLVDISIPNTNVFYELGVRHGVCPHGVFVVNSNLASSRPFDIAPDRSFSYEGSLFIEAHAEGAPAAHGHASVRLQKHQELALLAKKINHAIAMEPETIGSPVYSHLPGLKPVNWDDIETSKARYFTALQADWLDCVQVAQADGRPGDILTLAMNAPTRLHEARILYMAATALIALCRYAAAERVLGDVIRLDPANADARVQLALVLSKRDNVVQAEQQLNKISSDYNNQPHAADLMGQVFRHLWHLSWKKVEDLVEKQKRARDASPLAMSAIQSFLKAHRVDSQEYFAGFNALLLAYVLHELGASESPWTTTEFTELTLITRYVANGQRQQAIDDGNYDQQFWSTTTLAGLLFMAGNEDKALTDIREACAIPAATSFQLQSFRDRLQLLAELDVQSGFVRNAMEIVDKTIAMKSKAWGCERVFIWAGYPVDEPKRKAPRFPATRVEAVTRAIEDTLKHEWAVQAGDLAITGATTETDIVFAEMCLELGARVRIMMREPSASESASPLWPFQSPEWHRRFHELLRPGERKEVWFDTKHLGSPVEGAVAQGPDFVARRQRQWLINTAEMEAEPITRRNDQGDHDASPSSSPERLYGLFLWDGQETDDADDPSFLIRRVNQFNGYQGQVKTIDPRE